MRNTMVPLLLLSVFATPVWADSPPIPTAPTYVETATYRIYPALTLREMPLAQEAPCTSQTTGSFDLMTPFYTDNSPEVSLCTLRDGKATRPWQMRSLLQSSNFDRPVLAQAYAAGLITDKNGTKVVYDFLYSMLETKGHSSFTCVTTSNREQSTGAIGCPDDPKLPSLKVAYSSEGLVIEVEGAKVVAPFHATKNPASYPGQSVEDHITIFLAASLDRQLSSAAFALGTFAGEKSPQDQQKILDALTTWYQASPKQRQRAYSGALGNMASDLCVPLAEPFLHGSTLADLAAGVRIIRLINTPKVRQALLNAVISAYPEAVDTNNRSGDWDAKDIVNDAMSTLGIEPSPTEVKLLSALYYRVEAVQGSSAKSDLRRFLQAHGGI